MALNISLICEYEFELFNKLLGSYVSDYIVSSGCSWVAEASLTRCREKMHEHSWCEAKK